jgi:hypothetical protein
MPERTSPRGLRGGPHGSTLLLGLIVVVGVGLRVLGLPGQSFWVDEVYTLGTIDGTLDDVLPAVRASESTPPVYYWAAWVWGRALGTSDFTVRGLSLLFGLATIPVVFALGRSMAGEVAGLAAAALVAVNPFLVWYSQEARAYALFTLLSLLSVLAFSRALDRPGAGWPLAWSAISALALATHYFASALVWPEAVWLAMRRRDWPTVLAIAVVFVVQIALLPLASDQRHNSSFIGSMSFGPRLANAPKQFLLGQYASEIDVPFIVGLTAALGLATLAYILLSRAARRAAAMPILLATIVVAVPVALAAMGADRFSGRNVIVALALALVGVGVGLTAAGGTLAWSLLAALLVCFSGVSVAVGLAPALQRDDWAAVARLVRAHHATLVVVEPGVGERALRRYAPELHPVPEPSVPVRRIAYARVKRPVEHSSVKVPGFAASSRSQLPSAEILYLDSPHARRLTPLLRLTLAAGRGTSVSMLLRR